MQLIKNNYSIKETVRRKRMRFTFGITQIFDLSFAFYMIAYTVYFQDESYSMMRNLATIFMVLSALMYWLKKPSRRNNIINLHTIWYGCFTILGFSSALWATSVTNVFVPIKSMIRVLLVTCFLVMRIKNRNDIEKILKMLVLTACYFAVFLFVNTPSYMWGSVRIGYYLNLNPNMISLTMAYAALICLYFVYTDKKRRILNIILMVIFMIIALFAGSRKGLTIIVFGVLLFFYFVSNNNKRFLVLLSSVGFLFLSYNIVMNIPELYNVIGYRVEGMFQIFSNKGQADVSTAERLRLVSDGFSMFANKPILGYGLNNFSYFQVENYYSHNNYIEILSCLGILGIIIYYWFPIKILFDRLRSKTKNNAMSSLTRMLIIILLLMGVGLVDYNDIRYQVYLCIVFIAMRIDGQSRKAN